MTASQYFGSMDVMEATPTSAARSEPDDEGQRLAALHAYQVLDTPADPTLDGLTAAVAVLLDVPIALISLVDEQRQWFKSRHGLDVTETPRDIAFCARVVESRSPLIVSDASQDPAFHENPLVRGEPHIRCYVGAPLRTREGHVLGTLCGIDRKPREFDEQALTHLYALADAVMSHLELQKRNAALQQSQAELEQHWQFFQHSTDLHCIASADGYFRRLNARWPELLGWSAEELLGKPFIEFVHPDDVAPTLEALRSLGDASSVLAFRNRYRRRGGGYCWLEWNAFPAPGGASINATARDVSEQVERERRTEHESRKLVTSVLLAQAILAETPSVIYAKDTELRFLLSNHKHAALLGRSAVEILGKTDRDLFGDEAHDIETLSREVMDAGEPRSSEFDLSLDGEMRTFHETIFPIRDDEGDLLGIAGIASDLTENRRHLRTLQRFSTTVERILHDLPVALLLSDAAGKLTLANAAASALCGQDDLRGTSLCDHVGDADSLRALLSEVLAQGSDASAAALRKLDLDVCRADGSCRPVELRVSPIALPDGDFVLVAMVDLGERKELERALEQAREHAELAALAKGRFLANMSHEIRTPMNAVLGFAQLLAADASLTTSQRDKVKTILRAGDHLLALVNQVLDMSVVESGHVQLHRDTIRSEELVSFMLEMFEEKAAASGIRLCGVVADEVPRFFAGDEGKLRQVLVNLVGNAVRVTRSGTVTLALRTIRDQEQDWLLFDVIDTGPGIPAADLERIFAPFEQAGSQTQRGGAGLGLAISRRYAQLFGGTLHAQSEVGKGTTFTLQIPLEAIHAQADNSGARITGPWTVAHLPAPPRILVVDDELDNLDVVTEMLQQAGFGVVRAASGEEALERVASEAIDAIVMDYRMPGLDGLQTTRAIRSLPDAAFQGPVLLLTASVFERLEDQLSAYGADAFLRKPVRKDELLGQIFALLHLEDPASPQPGEAQALPVAGAPTGDAAEGDLAAVLPSATRSALLKAAHDSDYNALMEHAAALEASLPTLAELVVRCANQFDYEPLIERLHATSAGG